MNDLGKISAGQFSVLIILFTIGSTIMISESAATILAGRDGWISSLLSLIGGLLLVLVYHQLAKRMGDLSFFEFVEKTLGKLIGKVISLLYFLYFFFFTSLILREVGDFITTHLLTETPIIAVFLLFLLVMAMAAYLGIEAIGRAAQLLLPLVILTLLFFFIFLLPESEPKTLLPLFANGLQPVLSGTFTLIGLPYFQLFIFLSFLPFIRNKDKLKRSFLVGVTVGGFINFIFILLSILVIGVEQSTHYHYPAYFLSQKISIGNIIERLEIFISTVWMVTFFFKLIIYFYACLITLTQLFNLKDRRPIIFPLLFTLVPSSILVSKNINEYSKFFLSEVGVLTFTFALIIPLIIFSYIKLMGKEKSMVKHS